MSVCEGFVELEAAAEDEDVVSTRAGLDRSRELEQRRRRQTQTQDIQRDDSKKVKHIALFAHTLIATV